MDDGATRSPGVREWSRWLAVVATIVLAQWLFFLVAPAVALPPRAAFGVAFGMVAASVLLVGTLAPAAHVRVLWLLALPLGALMGVAWVGASGGPWTVLLVTGGLLTAGSLVGGVVGARIQHPGHLWIVALVASMADLYSVLSSSGPSAQVAASAPALSLVALSWAMPGIGALEPILGVGDVVMAALFLGSARRLGLGLGRALVALSVGFGATFAALLLLEVPVPALPFLGAAFVVANPAVWTLREEDRRPALFGLVALSVVFTTLWVSC